MARWLTDDPYLIAHYKTMSDDEIGRVLGRTPQAVKQRRNVLHLCVRGSKWTDGEVQFLRDNYLTMTARQMSAVLGRSEMAVSVKRNDLNLLVRTYEPHQRKVKKPIPKDYKPSYIPISFSDELKNRIDTMRQSCGTYGGRT